VRSLFTSGLEVGEGIDVMDLVILGYEMYGGDVVNGLISGEGVYLEVGSEGRQRRR